MTKKSQDLFHETADLINSISPSFCVAKWKQLSLHLQNGRNHSCHHPYPHSIPLNELLQNASALHNTEYKKKQREMMLKGVRPEECQYCWNIEDTLAHQEKKIFSDRITKSADTWAREHLPTLQKLNGKENINPSYLELSFSSACQFKCSYCSPVYSTRWQEEIEIHGAYPTSARFNDLEYFKSKNELPFKNQDDNPYVNAFWEWWPSLKNDLHVLRITGGEPLLSPNTFKLLDLLATSPLPHLQLAINTNAGVSENVIRGFIEKAKFLLENKFIASLHIFTSIDGYGAAAEYSRHGLNFTHWQNNVSRLLNEISGVRLTFMCTTNVFSVANLSELLEYVYHLKTTYKKHRITIDTNILRFPHHQNICILNNELKSCFDSSLKYMLDHSTSVDFNEGGLGFYDFEINRLARLIEYLKLGAHKNENLNVETARADFYLFVNEHDRRRNTNFKAVFPQLLDFYLLCEKTYQERASI